MILDDSLPAELSQMTDSSCGNASSVSMLSGRGADTAIRKKEKDGRTWLHVDPNSNRGWPQWAITLLEIIIIIEVFISKFLNILDETLALVTSF